MQSDLKASPVGEAGMTYESAVGNGRHTLVCEALLREYDFVSSLIPMYRGFEVQALHLGVIIFAGAVGFVASALESGHLELVYFIAAFLPWPMTTLMLMIAGSEVRIMRASLHVDREISKRFARYTGDDDVLTWEHSPSALLTPGQKRLAGSWTFIAVIAFPALVGGLTALIGGFLEPDHRVVLWLVGGLGLVFLTYSISVPVRISQRHEHRQAAAREPHTPNVPE